MGRTLPMVLLGLLCACQTHDFEPVEPFALTTATMTVFKQGRALKPNLMLVVDKSGSMDEPVERTAAGCQTSSGTCGSKANLCDPGVCPTRWSELQGAMGAFLTESGQVGRFGLTTFPNDAVCGAPDRPRIDVASAESEGELSDWAARINAELQRIQSSGAAGTLDVTGGGTPTGTTLAMLASYEPLKDSTRDSYVLLLTDGLPNCNPDNPADYTVDPLACRCTLAGADCTVAPRVGCLDAAATREVISGLLRERIKTIVVGFGAEAQTGDARQVLMDLARAGDFRTGCKTDADCGGAGACDLATELCPPRFFAAGNRAELAAALAAITEVLPGVCDVPLLHPPSDPLLMSVLVDGRAREPGPDSWTYTQGKVVLQGSLCEELKASTREIPVEVRVAEPL